MYRIYCKILQNFACLVKKTCQDLGKKWRKPKKNFTKFTKIPSTGKQLHTWNSENFSCNFSNQTSELFFFQRWVNFFSKLNACFGIYVSSYEWLKPCLKFWKYRCKNHKISIFDFKKKLLEVFNLDFKFSHCTIAVNYDIMYDVWIYLMYLSSVSTGVS